MSFEITAADLSALALGSGVLACGGGGNPYYGQLVARQLIAERGSVQVIDLEEMAPAALVLCTAIMGAPLVGIEKPPSLRALRAAFDAAARSLGERLGAFVAVEVGGIQSVLPLLLAALTGRPVIDGDGMGRAFPEAQMCTFLIYGMRPALPCACSDDHGLLWRLPSVPIRFPGGHLGGTGRLGRVVGLGIERVFRSYCASKGGLIYFTFTLDRPFLERALVRGSIRLALQLGRAVERAGVEGGDPTEAILCVAGGRRLFRGRIADVERRFRTGHDWGTLRLEGVDADRGRRAEIAFKNEYLILHVDRQVVLTVPDLITLVETDSGTPVTTEVVRTGLRVSVLGLRSSPLYHTPEALRVAGPRAFGYDLPFVSLDAEGPG
ncbi:MAG TPA: DUF917 domain-containing protein [Candidatus Dormibacteraeota bacterium]|nr:DUF917 domain-containing protein [Candidatus Dormibacteraeota bacterium]